jgi:hypothetical protein
MKDHPERRRGRAPPRSSPVPPPGPKTAPTARDDPLTRPTPHRATAATPASCRTRQMPAASCGYSLSGPDAQVLAAVPGFAAAGGPTLDAFDGAIRQIGDYCKVNSVSLTSYNPPSTTATAHSAAACGCFIRSVSSCHPCSNPGRRPHRPAARSVNGRRPCELDEFDGDAADVMPVGQPGARVGPRTSPGRCRLPWSRESPGGGHE